VTVINSHGNWKYFTPKKGINYLVTWTFNA
jgi:hypothetical protein